MIKIVLLIFGIIVGFVIFIFMMYLAGFLFFSGMLAKIEQFLSMTKKEGDNNEETLN